MVDRCPACGGFWFDSGEVQDAIRTAQIPRSPRAPTVKLHQPLGACGPCPRCGAAMKAVDSQAVPDLEYDRCCRCDGVWFDAGEAERFADDVGLFALMLHEFDPGR
jgi:Zn-finger nucleic acid-binding protein